MFFDVQHMYIIYGIMQNLTWHRDRHVIHVYQLLPQRFEPCSDFFLSRPTSFWNSCHTFLHVSPFTGCSSKWLVGRLKNPSLNFTLFLKNGHVFQNCKGWWQTYKNLKSKYKVFFVVDKVNIQTLINIKFLIHENWYDKE